jgi:hypothetical protein
VVDPAEEVGVPTVVADLVEVAEVPTAVADPAAVVPVAVDLAAEEEEAIVSQAGTQSRT